MIDLLVNDVPAIFLIDTGASNSCVDLNKVKKFNLKYNSTIENSSSATGEINNSFISYENKITIGDLIHENLKLILFDMNYINKSINTFQKIEIDGILGSEILVALKAQINYKNNFILFN